MDLDVDTDTELRRLRRNGVVLLALVCAVGVFAVLNVLEEDWFDVGANVLFLLICIPSGIIGWRRERRLIALAAESEARTGSHVRRWRDA